jgi:two-component system NtrC family sensor kinase
VGSVLVVDDEKAFADTLAERLVARGIEAFAVYDGASALAAAAQKRPQIVLLDLSMPGMDGLRTLKALKETFPQIEVVLLTAERGLQAAVRGMQAGARDYIVKPAPLERVLEAIHEAETHRMDAARRQRMAETARLAALGVLAAAVAHEINNPLQIIVNETGWMEELLPELTTHSKLHQELATSLGTIRHQAQRCKTITAQLLTLRATTPPRDTPQPFQTIVQHILDERRQRWEAQVHVEVSCPSSIVVPAAPWKQIIQPLVDNALDALEQAPASKRLAIIVQQHNDELEVRVEDSGPGMPPATQTRIFEPFFSTKDVGQGLGLGLSLCHAVVEALHGRIEVHSALGAGTTMIIRVPNHATNAPAIEPATTKEVTNE